MNVDAQAALAALRARFLVRTAEDLRRLKAVRDGEPAAQADIRFLVHRLAGAAGTFGYPEAGAIARRLDDEMLQRQISPAEFAPLIDALEALPPT